MDEKVLAFSNTEFIMLSMLLGADKIVGITDTDNITHIDEKGLQSKWDTIKKKLQEKNYIKEETDDTLQVDETVYSLMTRYISANRYMQIQVSEKGIDKASELLFISNNGNVNITIQPNEEDSLTISLHENTTAIRILEKYINIPKNGEQKASLENRASLSKAQYYEYMSYMNLSNIEKSAELLTNTGMNEEIAHDAAKGFYNKNLFVSITAADINDPDKLPQMVMFFFGENNIFNMRVSENDDEAFIIRAISESEFWNAVKSMAGEETV